jgi:hypothetical protein
VLDVKAHERDGDKWVFDLTAEDGKSRAIQRSVTRLASDNSLALLSCDEMRLNLEKVFLKLIGARDDDDDDRDLERDRERGRRDRRDERDEDDDTGRPRRDRR